MSDESSPKKNSESSRVDDWDSDGSVVDLDFILEAEAQHGPLFRRELFDVAYAAWQTLINESSDGHELVKDMSQSKEGRGTVTLLDIYGNQVETSVTMNKSDDHSVTKRVWMYESLQRLGHLYGQNKANSLRPYTFGWRYIDDEEIDCFEPSVIEAKAPAWEQEWQDSKLCSRLTDFLNQHASSTIEHVDKIICFGLGCFATKQERAGKRDYFQHLAARTIRDIFAQRQGGPAPDVYVQEPIYCTAGIDYIESHFGFKVVNDPEGFKALDGHTFVLTVSPNVPVRQVTMGMTHKSQGPAGFLCNAIDSDGLECNGKGYTREKDYLVCPYTTCPTSPALWKYKNESLWMEHNDKEEGDYFGKIGVYLKRKTEGPKL